MKNSVDLIPHPTSVTSGSGRLNLTRPVRVFASESEAVRPALAAVERWLGGTREADPDSAQIALELAPGEMAAEAYTLEVGDRVVIRASDEAGLFYGVQTMRQLAEVQANGWVAPRGRIEDSPAWGYRGFMLDVGRNFMSVEFLKRQIDIAASYKLNVFHFHLTEFPGWRFETKAFPDLKSEQYYSQEEMREIVEYAAERCMTVVPEIEMPGHSTAFLKMMPHLKCTNNTMCMGSEETYATLETILTEVAGIFPGPYIHIGTDECRGGVGCARCAATWEALQGYAHHPPSLMAYFIGRINEVVKGLGRTTMVWNDQLDEGLPEDVTVFAWRHDSNANSIAQRGWKTVNCHCPELYFDYGSPAQYIPIIYNWSPDNGQSAGASNILGGEAEAWHDPPVDFEEQIVEDLGFYPRLLTVAERVWAGAAGSPPFEEFHERLLEHKARFFSSLAFPYPEAPEEPWQKRYEGKWPPPPEAGLTME